MEPARPAALLAAAAVLALLTGCSSGSGSATNGPAGSDITAKPFAGASPAIRGTEIDIRIAASSVSPSGTKVEVSRGKPVTLVITAARKGQLHVHSSPEQHVDFPKGRSTATLRLDQPGIVDIEDHALDKLIVQLQVR
jgi:hypothetical protein